MNTRSDRMDELTDFRGLSSLFKMNVHFGFVQIRATINDNNDYIS
jgi:hypothetical protein